MAITPNITRRQLTLFVQDHTGAIEKIRKEFNRVQFQLIPAHVTLCREDEIERLETVVQNIKSLIRKNRLRIEFGAVERFENGKGVLLPAKGSINEFVDLRKEILKGLNDSPRRQLPHITLLHPRNSTCTDVIFNQIKQYELPTELSFDTISLIEQKNGGPWTVLDEFQITIV